MTSFSRGDWRFEAVSVRLPFAAPKCRIAHLHWPGLGWGHEDLRMQDMTLSGAVSWTLL